MTTWSYDWFPLPGQAVFDKDHQDVAAVTRAPGNLDLFVIGNDAHIWSTWWNDQAGWSGLVPAPRPGRLRQGPSEGRRGVTRTGQPGPVRDRQRRSHLVDLVERPSRLGSGLVPAPRPGCLRQGPSEARRGVTRARQPRPVRRRQRRPRLVEPVERPSRLVPGLVPAPRPGRLRSQRPAGCRRITRARQPRPLHRRQRRPRLVDLVERPSRLGSGLVPAPRPGRLRSQRPAGCRRITRARQPRPLHRRQRRARWSTWWNDQAGGPRTEFPLPGQAVFDRNVQQVAAVSRAPGNLDLFIVGNDAHVWSTWWNDQAGWSRTGSRCPARRCSTATRSWSPRSRA